MSEGRVESLASWTRQEVWSWFDGAPVRVIGTILGAIVIRWVLHRVIRRTIDLAIDRGDRDEAPHCAGKCSAIGHVYTSEHVNCSDPCKESFRRDQL